MFSNENEFKCKLRGLFEALEARGDQVSSHCCDGDGGGEETAPTHRAFSRARHRAGNSSKGYFLHSPQHPLGGDCPYSADEESQQPTRPHGCEVKTYELPFL